MVELKAVIIEDEIDSRENLKNLLAKYCEGVTVIGEAESVQQGLKLLRGLSQSPDVVFLDIHLKDGLSFQMLDQLLDEIDFEIIFATAYNQFAVTAFNYSAVGYLLKPFNPEELVATIDRIKGNKPKQMKKRLDLLSQNFNNPNTFEKMSISAVDGIHFINIRDIVRCEGEDNYTHIFLRSKERITVSKTIKEYERLLEPLNFYRVHKSHIVNLNYIQRFVKGEGGYLIMEDGMQIEVSRRRKTAFMEKLKEIQQA
jgi:two-component system LytT family response regulator